MFEFLSSPAFKMFSSALTLIAGGIMTVCPPHTIAFQVAQGVLTAGAAFGIHSTGTAMTKPGGK